MSAVLDLCDKWDIMSKGESPTTKAIREAHAEDVANLVTVDARSVGWWHRLRWVVCGICGQEFRKGRGGGVSRRVLCSERCARQAWVNWLKEQAYYRKAVRTAITGETHD